MDIEKLIEQLNGYFDGKTLTRDAALDAATALSAQQDENEKLRAELEQMSACIYYKPGGLCRYGGDDPANVCVFGPCPHEVSAQEFLSELENVKRERDVAVNAIRTWRFCESCKFGSTPMNYDCLGCYRASKWVWNGQKEDDNA